MNVANINIENIHMQKYFQFYKYIQKNLFDLILRKY